MKWKSRNFLGFFLIANIYCLILGWFNGGSKLSHPISYFFHFLTWWCTWNSLLTIAFVLWNRNPRPNTYFSQLFSLITMVSNLISMAVYGTGLILWLTTSLTTNLGLTSRIIKLVPITSHKIMNDGVLDFGQLGKVIHWWLYSPLWHLISPSYFLYWFFVYQPKNLLRKKLRLTIYSCLVMPATYFLYCFLRSKLGDRNYFREHKARWPYNFLSSKIMAEKLGIGQFRFVWKILLALFWFTLFSLIVYFSLRFSSKIKKNFSWLKKKQTNKQSYLLLKILKKNSN